MRHNWVFDVLADLHNYALANDLPDLADKVAEALTLARREIGPDQEGQTAPEMRVFRARRRAH